jgi:hypothetical protein
MFKNVFKIPYTATENTAVSMLQTCSVMHRLILFSKDLNCITIKQVNMQMALSKLQGHYAIRHIYDSEKTELVFSAIYSIKIMDNPTGKG